MSSIGTKEALFRRGAAALQRLSGNPTEIYICPICGGAFGRDSLESGVLTLDHVPPRAIGGRTGVLTCKNCNSTAGHALEADVHGRERAIGFRDSVLNRSSGLVTHGRLKMGGERLNVTFGYDAGSGRIEIKPHANDPSAVARLNEYLEQIANGVPSHEAPPQLTIEMARGFHGRRALVGDLKTAYLAAFAVLGYSYAPHPVLDVVRRQIRKPEATIIESWWLPSSLGQNQEPEFSLITVDVDPPFECVHVRLKRSTVLLPMPNGEDVYARFAVAMAAGQKLPFRGWPLPWPKGLELLLDFADVLPEITGP